MTHFTPFPSASHDHTSCVTDAVATAASLCERRGARLTPVRRRVLELVWGSHEPVGAYGILEILQKDGRSAAPPTVYRALEFLLAHGLIHRIESMNAFVGCAHPDEPHGGQFLICRDCGTAAELDDQSITEAVAHGAEALGFEVQDQTVEVSGLCPSCRERQGVDRDANPRA
jgi:Fur family zinc uptake transcriptional regulator